MTHVHRIAILVFAIALGFAGQHTEAQSAGAQQQPGLATAASGQELQEIVVTAEKREQTLSTTGTAISAFSGDTLDRLGIKNVQDLALAVPGFTVSQTNNNVQVYTLRGVGFYETTLAVYPDVSVYMDEVTLPFPALATHVQLDDSRVEVLKGPQGILFGSNSTGGAINFVGNRPTSTPESGVELSYSRFNTFIGEGYVSGPISSTLAGRLAVQVEQGDGWQDSVTRPDDRLGAKKSLVGRIALDWKPNDGLSVKFKFDGWDDRGQAQAAQLHRVVAQVPALASPTLLNYPTAPPKDTAADWDAGFPIHNNENFGLASVRVDYDLPGNMTLTSISSYAAYQRDDFLDTDGTSLEIEDSESIGRSKDISQELRLGGDAKSSTRWLAGVNYQQDNTFQKHIISIADATQAQALGLITGGQIGTQDMKNYAVFGNVEQDFLQTLTGKIGARFTQANRDFTGCDTDTGDGRTSAFFTGLSRALKGDPTAPAIPAGACVTLDPNFDAGLLHDKLNQNNVSWRAGLDWKPLDATLIYANISKGYKAGSFPVLDGATNAQYKPVVQESVVDYELGTKIKLLDRRLFIDMSAFHYDYTNKQLRGEIQDPVFGLLDALVNVPKSTVNGADLSATWQDSSGFSLNVAGTYLDAKITRFTGLNNAGVEADFAGDKVPYSPKWSVAANADYQSRLPGTSLRGFVGAGINFNSATTSIIGTDPDFTIDQFALVNARLGIGADDDHWRVTLWGKNLTDRYYWTNVIRTTDVIFRYAGMPATYGITATFRSH